jgi:glycerol transport system ATP-binding protein
MPSLVLLDEPLANLDYKLREELRAELPKHLRRNRRDLRLCDDRAAEALLLGGNTATLSEGRVTQFGPTIEVYRRPRSHHRAHLLRSAAQHDRRRQDGRDFVLGGNRSCCRCRRISPACRRPPTRSASSRTTWR